MATKRKTGAAAKPVASKPDAPKGRMVATMAAAPDPEKARAYAELALQADANAAAAMAAYTRPLGVTDEGVGELSQELRRSIERATAGDLKGAEEMLYGQAHALQAIFMSLARRAANQEYLKQWEAYLRMALKAQSQCRMTLETLATIKNPPVVFARQANINNGGQQQVNNGQVEAHAARFAQACAPARAPAEILGSEQNGLLGMSDGQRLDTGTQGAASGADPHMATMGAINRAKDDRG